MNNNTQTISSSAPLQLWHSLRIPFMVFAIGLLAFKYFTANRQPAQKVLEKLPIAAQNVPPTEKPQLIESQVKKDLKPARRAPKRITSTKIIRKKKSDSNDEAIQIYVFYSSLCGATEKFAQKFVKDLFAHPSYIPTPAPPPETTPEDVPPAAKKEPVFLTPILHNVDYLNLDDFFTSPKDGAVYLILLPTYNITSPIDVFIAHLTETHHDFRIDSKPLRSIRGFSVFGFGDKEDYPDEGAGGGAYCGQAKEVDRWMSKLTGGKRLFPIGMGDVKGKAQASLDEWRQHLEIALKELPENVVVDVIDSEDEEDVAEDEPAAKMIDVEDLGKSVKAPIPIDFTTTKEMVAKNSPTYNALTKQGYTIVGSHSGVKLCRWTKSALRGRGSCYKFSFYGIKSYLCMETTPSLSCSNKCVFCWRHGTNPVSTTWKWKVDQPDYLLRGVMEGHYKKIKMMKGVPGVRAERFAEAFTIRHCALSLVGEPIFYPYINEFLSMLHERHISSFLVCNAQHPDQLAALEHVTQLYVSIDASNKESLKKIDRPLHRDFWERFQRCLDIIKEKKDTMRTVFRLTLVKGFNVDEVEGYADLVEKGLPSFVEIKGVTYCGTSTSVGAGLTMQNVPFYEEVAEFVTKLNEALERRGLHYGIAAEHAHSCCVLIASNDYYIDGKWHTLIDYQKFFELLESGKEFGPLDYVGEATPEWATWGQGGFDPADQRVYTKGKNKGKIVGPNGELIDPPVEEAVDENESGCG